MQEVTDIVGSWREKLLDLSKRNRLINCRTGAKASAVLLGHPQMEAIWKTLIDGETLRFPWKHELLEEETDDLDSITGAIIV